MDAFRLRAGATELAGGGRARADSALGRGGHPARVSGGAASLCDAVRHTETTCTDSAGGHPVRKVAACVGVPPHCRRTPRRLSYRTGRKGMGDVRPFTRHGLAVAAGQTASIRCAAAQHIPLAHRPAPAANTPESNAESAFMATGRHRDRLRGTAAVAVICRPAYLAAEWLGAERPALAPSIGRGAFMPGRSSGLLGAVSKQSWQPAKGNALVMAMATCQLYFITPP